MGFNYTPELSKAKKELFKYMEKHHLSFYKDYRNDPIHGKIISLLLLKINKERDKIMEDYPIHDSDNNRKFLMLKARRSIMKKVKDSKKTQAKKVEKEEKVVKKEKKTTEKKKTTGKGRTATKYDYPLIDGREMTSSEKKKYRMEQRKLANGETPKEKDSSKKVKKTKEDKPKKEDKKAKVKKHKKEED